MSSERTKGAQVVCKVMAVWRMTVKQRASKGRTVDKMWKAQQKEKWKLLGKAFGLTGEKRSKMWKNETKGEDLKQKVSKEKKIGQ